MRRVSLGARNREVASALGLSDSTVKQEVQRVMRTMRTSDRLVAAERARTLGLM
jgi:DNA-binding NarL/FixJ family response regulator